MNSASAYAAKHQVRASPDVSLPWHVYVYVCDKIHTSVCMYVLLGSEVTGEHWLTSCVPPFLSSVYGQLQAVVAGLCGVYPQRNRFVVPRQSEYR